MSGTRGSVAPLAAARQEIESIDRSIVLLLAARLAAAQRALRLRVSQHHGLTDVAQEHRVLERSRRWARGLGVPESLVERLFRTLLEEGKARYRSTEAPLEPACVTVLLAAPEAGTAPLQGSPRPEVAAEAPLH